MSAEAETEQKVNRDPSLRNRMAGQSRTILLYPLCNTIEEADIEEFVKRASLSSPLRIELFKFQSSTNENDQDIDIDIKCKDQLNKTSNYNGYAYCTFTSSSDCWLIKKHLNNKLLNGHKVSITFSVIPRNDLEGITNIVEFGTNYPPITHRNEIIKFLNSYKNDTDDDDIDDISNPKNISAAPGHGGIKGKWYLTYDSPEIATKALEFYSGKYYFDTENNKNRFVIINYQSHRDKYPLDRRECFFGITDRVILRNIHPNINDNDDILLFLQSNGFDVNSEIFDVYIIHQMVHIVEEKYNRNKQKKNQKKFKPKPGFAIITFSNYKLANKAYTILNNKNIANDCKITTGFTSPSMTDPLKKILKGHTNVVHLSNLPWNINKEEIKEFLFKAGKKYVEQNKHLKINNNKTRKDDDDEKQEMISSDNPFYSTDVDAGKFCTHPINIYIKYRDGYSTGRANATFAKNEEADIVIDILNGKKLNGRKININWALPIKDYKFKEQRNIALHLDDKAKKKQKPKEKEKKKEKEIEKDDNVESVAFKKIKKWQSKRKSFGKDKTQQTHKELNKWKKSGSDIKEKRGKKRRGRFGKPGTKKIKLTL